MGRVVEAIKAPGFEPGQVTPAVKHVLEVSALGEELPLGLGRVVTAVAAVQFLRRVANTDTEKFE